MNEFHGWINIREKYDGDTIDWSNQCSILADIGKKVEDFYFDDCFIELKKCMTHTILLLQVKLNAKDLLLKQFTNYLGIFQ